ncbi:MAG: phage holin family protein [Actinomycetota bacterium]|nr:phage holin family protein [Actinomycetota bacterium]
MALQDLFKTKSPFDELRSTVIAYVKQETLGPAKALGRYLAFGVAGAITILLGVSLLLLALLRLLQTETGTAMTGNLSWIPYLLVAVAGALVAVTSFTAARRKASAKELMK